jgi:glycerol-3-phosphate acyltransferase PlsX
MRIAIDGMGGDHAPTEVVRGAIEAAKQLPDVKLLLVGQRDRLAQADLPSNIEIIHAAEVVGMDEEPARALRGKPDSSLRVSLRLVKRGEADACISAGNTGALVGGAIVPVFGLGNLEGVKRPGIAVPFPSEAGFCALIDAGANPNAKPVHLVQYAVMGSVYIRYIRPDCTRPRVGLLNIGEESKKGTDLQRETYDYLEKAELNFEFVGNIEPHRMFTNKVDVVVCDGFTGNLAIKMAEGVTSFILSQFQNGSPSTGEIQAGLRKATDQFDHSEYGGAPVLGCRGTVIKSHGRSNAKAITNAVKMTAGFVRGRLNDHIVDELRKLSWSKWFTKWFSWSKEGE